MKKNFTKSIILLLTLVIINMSVYAQNTDESVSKKEVKEVVEAVSKQLEDNYVFPEIGKKMANQLKKNLKKGKYKDTKTASVFKDQLTNDLVGVSKDKHIRVIFDPKGIADQKQAVTPEDEQKLMDEHINRRRMSNFGFNEVKILEGNIGYLDLRSFQEPSYAGDTAVAAMNLLSNSDALIIDLTQNGGGSPQMIQLISSYLFDDEPVHLNNFYWRPTDSPSQTWTLPHVTGKRYPDIPVYVLTSNRTFSAAEEFSYNLKNLKRATLVGETTGGGAHPGGTQVATDRFLVWVPSGRAINPITNTNWEGTGVSPHIAVKKEMALNTAYIKALEKLAETNKSENAQAIYSWVKEGLKAKEQVLDLTQEQLQSYVGNYGPRKVSFENGSLYYQRGEGNKYKLVPMAAHKFMIAEVQSFRVQFDHEKDKVVALVGKYDNGHSDRNEKD
jgi:C-terminal processing protease CtpA/Prc